MRTRNLQRWLGLLVPLTIAACGGGGGEDSDGSGPTIPVTTTRYEVRFSSDQVIAATAAPSSVTATADLSTARGDGTTASGSVTVSGTTATAVTVNAGFAGENGPVAISLAGGSGGTWNVPAGTELDDADFFRLDASGYYVSIRTPEGELRGQILPPGWLSAMVTLDDDQVIPAASSSGTAVAGFSLHPATGRLRLRMTIGGVSDILSAGLRTAIAGSRGDVAVAMEASASDPDVWGTRDINNVDAGDILTQTGIDLLSSGALYFGVATAANPDGELRGQVVDDSIAVVDVPLVDYQVVSSEAPVDSDAQGVATVTWVSALQRLGVAVNTDLASAIGVSVHQGAPGENGPPVLTLIPDVTLSGNWFVPPTNITADQAAALDAGNLYVQIVTDAYPEGELRGQVSLDPPGSPAVIAAVTDPQSLRQTPIDAGGGELALTATNGSQVTATIRDFTVLDMTEFSMTEIVSVSGFPEGTRLLAAAQMGPAGRHFAQPVTMTFDVTGLRSPESVLVGFRTDDNGTDLRLMPLRDALGESGRVSTARTGTQVELDVLGFSNIGVIEIPADNVPTFSFEVISQQPEPDFDDEMILDFFNAVLDTDLSVEDINALSDERMAELIRNRRSELLALLSDFVVRPSLTTDDRDEYLGLYLAYLYTVIPDSFDNPLTSTREQEIVFGNLVTLSEVYGAGLHLQCFVDPAGIESVLEEVSVLLVLRVGEELLAGNPDVSFDDIVARAKEISRCYDQAVLDAYFQSFDVPVGDEMSGIASNIISLTVDNLAGTTSTGDIPDMPASLQLIEPRLVSTSPLTFEFKEASDTMLGLYDDTVRLVFDEPNGTDRSGRLEFADEEVFTHVPSAAEQEDGELPLVTIRLENTATGTILAGPTSLDFAYTFHSRETTNAQLENLTRGLQGDLQVGKSFTPESFAAEIELYD